MAQTQPTDATFSERVNQLYWSSDQTVDQITEELGIGRSTLYSSLRPQPAGASCPDCGERMVYTNRSNRAAGMGTCRTCGTRAAVDMAQAIQVERDVDQPAALGVGATARAASREALSDPGRDGEEEGGWARWRNDLAHVPPERAAMIGGAAALGLMVGAVAARAIREMR